MESIKKIVFVAGSGTGRAPMAAELMKQALTDKHIEDIQVEARGLIVQFPEPMNPKALAVLASNGINVDEYQAEQLQNEDVTEGTMLFIMKEEHRAKVIEDFENATEENVFVLSSYVGDEIEIINPYGGSIQTYGLCYEVLKSTIDKLIDKLF
ncbi:MAG: phosphotyrosine protein phosphatase [Lachnospiraceae bacterium]|nr:phosphotyrosine protein phosphatase [Lachnospiraceae bacterium]